jgi:hypothetical protein
MRRAIIPALLLVLLSVVLGATVFREQVAHAASAVLKVREQNLDAQGNIKVHEQGTANVNVTNSSLSVAPPASITAGGDGFTEACGSVEYGTDQVASALAIHMDSGVQAVVFFHGGAAPAVFVGPASSGNKSVVLALTRPIAFDKISCIGTGYFSVSRVGNSP